MTPAIQQSVEFPASPETLFELYLDSKKHSAATGSKARLGRKAGQKFTAFEGMLEGKNLLVIPNKLIVQAWRSTGWKKADPDSILILSFSRPANAGKNKNVGQVDLVHVNVPEYDHAGVTKGWDQFYWTPWQAYLAAKKK